MDPRSLVALCALWTVALMEISLAFPATDSDNSASLTEIASRVDRIENRVDVLTDGRDTQQLLVSIDRSLDSIEHKLAMVPTSQGGVGDNSAPTQQPSTTSRATLVTEPGEDGDFATNVVDLLSINRTHTPQGNRFTIRLTKNTDDLLIRLQSNMGAPRAPDSITEEADGVLAVVFTLPNTTITQLTPFCIISDTSFYRLIVLRVNNGGNMSMSQAFPHLPVIHLDPPRRALYDPGQDVLVSAYVLRDPTSGEVVENMRPSFSGIDLDTGKYRDIYIDHDDLFVQRGPDESEDRISGNVTIMTSTHGLSGYFQLTTEVDETGGALVQSIGVSRFIQVYPSSQSGPFPDGYLAFAEYFMAETSANGNDMIPCTVGHECPGYCMAVGESVSDIEVHKIMPDGTLGPVPSAEISTITGTDNMRTIYWKFQSELGVGDSNGLTTFQCLAYDARNRQMITKNVDLQVAIPSEIVEEASNVTVTDHPMEPYLKTLTFNCAVRGRPIPYVEFGSDVLGFYQMSPSHVTNVSATSAVATYVTEATVSDIDEMRSFTSGQGSGPYCEFFNPYNGRYDRHTFDLPSA